MPDYDRAIRSGTAASAQTQDGRCTVPIDDSPATAPPCRAHTLSGAHSPICTASHAGHTDLGLVTDIGAYHPAIDSVGNGTSNNPMARPRDIIRSHRAIGEYTGRAATRATCLRLQLFPQGIRFRPIRPWRAIWRQPERICRDMGHCSAAPRPRHVPHRPFGARGDCAWQNARQ